MADDPENSSEKHVKTAANWTKILTGCAGALLLGLQGINLSEVTHGNENGDKRMQVLEQLLSISRDMKELLKKQTEILENGAATLKNDDRSLKQQGEILETLRQAIAERKDLLERMLPAPAPAPAPTPN